MGTNYELHRLMGSLLITWILRSMWWALSDEWLGVGASALLLLAVWLIVHWLALWLAKR